MKFINELKEGDNIIGHYLCKSKQTLRSRAGKNYLSLKLQDKTGIADAKVWDLNNDIKNFEENTFIKIDGMVISYQNDIQINIKRLRPSESWEYDPMDYIPSTEKDIGAMQSDLLKYIDTLDEPYMKRLLQEVFINNAQVAENFSTHSAAKQIHHQYLGGLLEHTLNVVEICEFMSGRFKHVNRDLLICAAMLHDIGKIRELSKFPVNDYTEEGQLLGHIYMGAELVSEAVKDIPGFPPMLETLIKHCILAHHGVYEYGSPKLPRTIEAYILHCADNMDAMSKVFEESLDQNMNAGSWTAYQRLLQRTIRKSDF